MMQKILDVLGSLTFWIATLTAASAYAAFVEANGFKVSELLNAIAIWLGSLTVLRASVTFSNNISAKK